MQAISLSIRYLLLFTLSLLTAAVVWFASNKLYTEWRTMQTVMALHRSTYVSEQMFHTIESLSLERDMATVYLSTPDTDTAQEYRDQLMSLQQTSDTNINAMLEQLENNPLEETDHYISRINDALARLQTLRQKLDHDQNARQWMDESTQVITQLSDVWMAFTNHFADINPIASQQVFFTHILGSIMEYSGRERALIGSILASNAPVTAQDREMLFRWHNKAEFGWQVEEKLIQRSGMAQEISPYISDARSHYANLHDMVEGTFYTQASDSQAYFMGTDFWFELSTQATDSLYALKNAVLEHTRHYVSSLHEQAKKALAINAVIFFFAILLCVYSFYMVTRRVLTPIGQIVHALVSTMDNKPTSISPKLAKRRDEIGELAKVLFAFQKNVDTIKRYVQDLERSNKELDDFAYIASHDLKEPLRGIHNHSRFLLEDNEGKLDPDSDNKLHRLVSLSQRMEDLVNDLLYFSRLGRQELAIQSTDVNQVVDDIKETLELFLHENHADIILPEPLPTITCDAVRLKEVLRNLITNAVKYNVNDHKTVEIGFREECAAHDAKVWHHVFYVRDNGIGIDPRFHEEIFRIFKRLQASGTGEKEGTGVGLTFVKKIVERHGGTIWLKSEPGQGSTFYFTMEILL